MTDPMERIRRDYVAEEGIVAAVLGEVLQIKRADGSMVAFRTGKAAAGVAVGHDVCVVASFTCTGSGTARPWSGSPSWSPAPRSFAFSRAEAGLRSSGPWSGSATRTSGRPSPPNSHKANPAISHVGGAPRGPAFRSIFQ